MIYIITNNIYLQRGVEILLYPLQAQTITPGPDNLDLITACNEWDVLVVDVALSSTLLTHWRGSISKPRVVFLSSVHTENIVFQCPGIHFQLLNCCLPTQRFRKTLIDAVAGNQRGYDCLSSTFTPREEMVFWASLKGLSITDIADSFYISTNTAYNHRLRACRKLGVRKVAEAIPLLGYFREYERRMQAPGAPKEKEPRLSGISPGSDLRSVYLRQCP